MLTARLPSWSFSVGLVLLPFCGMAERDAPRFVIMLEGQGTGSNECVSGMQKNIYIVPHTNNPPTPVAIEAPFREILKMGFLSPILCQQQACVTLVGPAILLGYPTSHSSSSTLFSNVHHHIDQKEAPYYSHCGVLLCCFLPTFLNLCSDILAGSFFVVGGSSCVFQWIE